MKATAAQLGAALDRGGGDIRLFLLHGPDEAAALDYVAQLGKALGPGADRIDVDGASLRGQPGRLADEAASISLFGGTRYLRVSGMGEDGADAVQLLLDAPSGGAPVVAIAPGVKASGKLVKLALASPHVMAFACYPPEGRQATQLAVRLARDRGVGLNPDAAELLLEVAGGERGILAGEIEKLALYLDAAPDRLREADLSAVLAIAARHDEGGHFSGIEAMLAGDVAALSDLVSGAEIPQLRAIARRLAALAAMRAEVDDGHAADAVVERHRVFWKERASTVALLRSWSAPRIAAALAEVRRAERALVSGNAGSLIAARTIVGVARAGARR